MPLLDNEVLRTFVAIAECGTFTAAVVTSVSKRPVSRSRKIGTERLARHWRSKTPCRKRATRTANLSLFTVPFQRTQKSPRGLCHIDGSDCFIFKCRRCLPP